MNMDLRITRRLGDGRGFTLVEVLVAAMILVVGLLSLATMFPVGYRQITDAGRMTMAVTGARHILEDIGAVPFANIRFLDNFDTTSTATLPAADPQQAIARRWRYMLAGTGDGFAFTPTEVTNWGAVNTFGARATVQMRQADNPANPCLSDTTATTCRATVTVTIPSTPNPVTVTLSTILVRMF
ncbi:MAG: hypothetical protein AUI57_07595 [Candidatus Rokubacteria bacterium 13_1_40CM_2_68_8]|nr:MAG: hypothetical protein AUI57_07595 [Candidatus Rokubacteria bacterium 13_1_40CM_2_68_8]